MSLLRWIERLQGLGRRRRVTLCPECETEVTSLMVNHVDRDGVMRHANCYEQIGRRPRGGQ